MATQIGEGKRAHLPLNGASQLLLTVQSSLHRDPYHQHQTHTIHCHGNPLTKIGELTVLSANPPFHTKTDPYYKFSLILQGVTDGGENYWRAGASQPSRATGTIFLYLSTDGRGHIPYILLNQRSRAKRRRCMRTVGSLPLAKNALHCTSNYLTHV